MKTVANKSSRGPKKASTVVQPMMELDPNEVLRAMMAAKKEGKRKADSSGEEEDTSGDSDDEEVEVKDEMEGEESIDEDFEAESSSMASLRSEQNSRKRSRTTSPDIKQERRRSPERSPLRKATALPSRVSAAASHPTAKPSANPFDGPKPPTSTTFASLGLSAPVINALASINIRKPTEIQAACVGPILQGRDCIGGAKTGSGKTLAFALPIVERILRDPFGVWAVILTPTRELAYQLSEQFMVIGKPAGLTVSAIVGGMDMMAQARELEASPHIIGATPGGLCDLIRSDGLSNGKLGRVKCLVLDEADRMLTETFAPELAYLFSQIPPQRQTCLFTATISESIMQLANRAPSPGKQKPFVYRIASDSLTVEGLKQRYLFIPSQIRDPYLLYLLHNPPSEIDISLMADPKKEKERQRRELEKARKKKRYKNKPVADEDEDDGPVIPSTIIFTQRCATANLLHLLLEELDVPSVPLHSHLTQPQRLESLARFRAREVPVLVTTDVGSRGLDIPSVAMVINWDCPRRADDYVHRVGRTARAGRGGVAVTVVTERDVELVKIIEGEIGAELQELVLPEEKVLERLNEISIARRVATMAMHDGGFGERAAINKAKAMRRIKRAEVHKGPSLYS